ncbi:transporter substrate-binding domain-containing protein [Brucella cytisi]|uniref:transporter substrate-binding domain-containing protein n=1 Tax=Brucella cytisi TaxID=407152 RepID=UPI0035D5D546
MSIPFVPHTTFLVASFFLSWGASASECKPSEAAEKYPKWSNQIVHIATVTTSPPFAFSDPKNPEHIIGIEAEIIEYTMQCAGLKYDFLKGPFASLIQSVTSGSTSIMIGNVNYRPERAQKLDFITFMESGQTVIVPKGNPKKIYELTHLCGKIGSSTVGGVGSGAIEKQTAACVAAGKSAITYVPSVDQEAALRLVVNRRADFGLDGSITAKDRVKAQADELEAALTISTGLTIGPVVRKDEPELRQVVLDGMRTMEATGKLTQLLEKYHLSEFARPISLHE